MVSSTNDDAFVVFISPTDASGLAPGAEQDYGKVQDFFVRSKEKVAAEWDEMIARLHELVSHMDVKTGQFRLNEVEFQLGFSAEGHVGFIAKAGANATVTVTFARSSDKEE